jgi:hypothetical protein
LARPGRTRPPVRRAERVREVNDRVDCCGDSKLSVTRYVAENINNDGPDAWAEMKSLTDALTEVLR